MPSRRLFRPFIAIAGAWALLSGLAALAGEPAEPSADDLAKTAALRTDMRRMIGVARDRVFPALVNISVVMVDYWGGKEHKHGATGSGTIISKDGYVLTNQHVTNDGKKFKCTLADKQEIDADLVGEDPLTDLAVLKLRLSQLKDNGGKLAVAQFGRSDELEIGDQVMAMGSPFALSRSVTLGIVSNTSRVLAGSMASSDPEEMELESGQRTGLFTRWIQHDALINPGNSGGPLVNLKGEVVGVNELGGSAIGFAIPSNLARQVAEALIAHKEVPRSDIGVSFRSIEKTGFEHGVLVDSITKDSPADKAGIQAGDLVLKINSEPTTVRFLEEVPPLLKKIADLPIGSKVQLSYERAKKVAEASLTTEKLKKDRGDETAFRAWGLTGMEITERMARESKLHSTEGVYVSSIRDGGSAALAEPPITGGDVIRAIDGQAIKDLKGFVEQYDKIMAKTPLPEYLLVEFDRRGKNHVTVLKPKPDKEEDPPREVAKAWIGIDTQPVLAKLADKLGQSELRGFRITRVYPKSKAATSDLKVGDVVTGLNGSKVTPRGMQDAGLLSRLVRKLNVDDEAKLTVVRDKKKQEVTVHLERTHIGREEARTELNRDFELTVREITFFDRDENKWEDDVLGVIVSHVERAGWAGLAGIRPGDLILKIDATPVRDMDSYRNSIEVIGKTQPKRIVMVVLRGVRTHYQYLEPDWKPVVANKGLDAKPSDTKEKK